MIKYYVKELKNRKAHEALDKFYNVSQRLNKHLGDIVQAFSQIPCEQVSKHGVYNIFGSA